MTFVAEPFLPLARFQARSLGLPELPLAVVEYPFGSASAEIAAARTEKSFPSVLDAFTRQLMGA